jgi:hypothetical protein
MLVAKVHKIGAWIAFVLLAAWLLIGSWQASPYSSQATQKKSTQSADGKTQHDEQWLTKDAAGFFTFLLVLVGGFQVVLFYVQLRLIRESLDDAKIAADAATVAANAATRQAKIAEESFAKLERPYIFIFDVGIFQIDGKSPVGDPRVYVTYSVANYGKTPAIIKYAGGVMHAARHTGVVEAGPDTPIPFAYNHNLITSPIITSGEVRTGIEQDVASGSIDFKFDETGDDLVPIVKLYDDLFMWIILTYRGPFTDHHETSMCWRWEEGDRRFIKHGKNNWEK